MSELQEYTKEQNVLLLSIYSCNFILHFKLLILDLMLPFSDTWIAAYEWMLILETKAKCLNWSMTTAFLDYWLKKTFLLHSDNWHQSQVSWQHWHHDDRINKISLSSRSILLGLFGFILLCLGFTFLKTLLLCHLVL